MAVCGGVDGGRATKGGPPPHNKRDRRRPRCAGVGANGKIFYRSHEAQTAASLGNAQHRRFAVGGRPPVPYPMRSRRTSRPPGGPGARLVGDDTADRFDILPLLVAGDGMLESVGFDRRRFRPNLVIGGLDGLARTRVGRPPASSRLGCPFSARAALFFCCISLVGEENDSQC